VWLTYWASPPCEGVLCSYCWGCSAAISPLSFKFIHYKKKKQIIDGFKSSKNSKKTIWKQFQTVYCEQFKTVRNNKSQNGFLDGLRQTVWNSKWFCPNRLELILDSLGKLSGINFGRFCSNRPESLINYFYFFKSMREFEYEFILFYFLSCSHLPHLQTKPSTENHWVHLPGL